MRHELDSLSQNISIDILKSPVQDRFFVKIIGRGYPPPTNSFRWCTKGLRIEPVSNFISKRAPDNTVVALGLRRLESVQRDRSMKKSSESHWQKQREGTGNYDLYLPIINLSVAEVWDAVFGLSEPKSISAIKLETLYRNASGECPVIRAPQAPPCASGRFGCWTCTVVRRDKSGEHLASSGFSELLPFLYFRKWLTEIRNDPAMRWPIRRNGTSGMGPFTIEARKEILERVNKLEDETRTVIVDSDERGVIASLWSMDHFSRLSFKGGPSRLSASSTFTSPTTAPNTSQ